MRFSDRQTGRIVLPAYRPLACLCPEHLESARFVARAKTAQRVARRRGGGGRPRLLRLAFLRAIAGAKSRFCHSPPSGSHRPLAPPSLLVGSLAKAASAPQGSIATLLEKTAAGTARSLGALPSTNPGIPHPIR